MNSEIPANIFRQKSKKLTIGVQKFFIAISFTWKNFSTSQSSSGRKNAILKALPFKSTPKVWKLFSQSPKKKLKKNIHENFFSAKDLGTRGRKGFQPL